MKNGRTTNTVEEDASAATSPSCSAMRQTSFGKPNVWIPLAPGTGSPVSCLLGQVWAPMEVEAGAWVPALLSRQSKGLQRATGHAGLLASCPQHGATVLSLCLLC